MIDATKKDMIGQAIPSNAVLFRSQPADIFVSLQKWEGAVLSVTKDAFSARLVDQTNPNPEEEAEFSIDELDPDDLELLEPGAIFYWNIGYLDKKSGRIRISDIRFRRLPAWTERDLKEAEIAAEELQKYFES